MNIVFDFGGVVFNWQPLQLLRTHLPRHAGDEASAKRLVVEFFQLFAPGGDWADFDLGLIDNQTVSERIARRIGLSVDEVQRVVEAIPAHLMPQPGTVALMRRLRADGHRLFYLSNMPTSYALILERENDFFGWFDAGVFSCRVGRMKPDPAIYHEAVQRFGVAPADLLFIDDVPHNIDAARSLGWQALHFQNPAQCEQALHELALLGGQTAQRRSTSSHSR